MNEDDKKRLQANLSGLELLYSQGLLKEAKALELSILQKHPEIAAELVPGVTQEILRGFITQDKEMLRMKDEVRELSKSKYNDSVLILGESGTGKEIVARALHGNRTGNFVAINCTSLPDYLLESELFGHVRGAFTGAVEDKIGLFQYANNGTIFLDEIGDMPLTLQAKMLRVLQDKKIRRVGDIKETSVNVRVVCATNQNLKGEGFREDLYHRLSVFVLRLKPLRNRLLDIPLIWQHITDIGGWQIEEKKVPQEATLLLDKKVNTTWYYDPHMLTGNVRELQAMARRLEVFGRIE